LPCFRGSLENTLQRVVDALKGFDDETVVTRLTADNVLPDGRFLDELEQDFLSRGVHYLCCNAPNSGLPYGLSAEVMRLKHLREAHGSAHDEYDLEHVTPVLIRRFSMHVFDKYAYRNQGLLRCTVDSLDDYLRMRKVFLNSDDAITVPALTLVDRLAALEDAPRTSVPVRDLILGGAQLGLPYGIANSMGQPSRADSELLVKTAVANGVVYVDTARAYGTSEEAIGGVLAQGWEGRFRVITKLAPLGDSPISADPATISAFVDASVFRSCTALRRQSLDVLMLHRAQHLDAWDGRIWRRLLALKELGIINELGVSVQTPAELMRALLSPDVAHIQLPFNILDHRWRGVIPEIGRMKTDRPIAVHVRSALLQGLLPSKNVGHWQRANVTNHEPVVAWLHSMASQCRRENVADLCFAYVRSQPWVDGVVAGMESLDQLYENIRYFSSSKLSVSDLQVLEQGSPVMPAETLDPARWRTH
jgi:spore coat polysaccharide biosynthesis protein SpsF